MEKILDRSLKILIALLIVAIPLSPRWGNYALIMLAIVAVLMYSRGRSSQQLPYIFHFLIGAYVIRLIWLMGTNDLPNGLKSLETEAPLAAIPLVFCFFKLSETSRRQFLKLYAWVCCMLMFCAFLNLVVYVYGSPFSFFEYLDLHLSNRKQMSEANMLNWEFAHPSFLSMFIIYGLIILFFLQPKRSGDRLFLGLYAVAGLIFTLLSGSRAGLLLIFFSFLIFAIIELKSQFRKKVPLFILIGSVVSGFVLYTKNVFHSGLDSLDTLRTATVIKATKAFLQRPLLGYGTGGEKAIIRDEHLESIGYSIYHPHNQYLTELLQFGIIGSLPLFGFVIVTIFYSIKHQLWDLFCVVLIFSVFMIFESPINSNKGLVPFMIAIVLIVFNNPIIQNATNKL